MKSVENCPTCNARVHLVGFYDGTPRYEPVLDQLRECESVGLERGQELDALTAERDALKVRVEEGEKVAEWLAREHVKRRPMVDWLAAAREAVGA